MDVNGKRWAIEESCRAEDVALFGVFKEWDGDDKRIVEDGDGEGGDEEIMIVVGNVEACGGEN